MGEIVGCGGEGMKKFEEAVAIKRVPLVEENAECVWHELRILEHLRQHRGCESHVVEMQHAYCSPDVTSGEDLNEVYFLMDFHQNTLRDLQYNTNVSDETILLLFRQALIGLNYIHKAGVVHRDISPVNLMVGDQGLQIIDFGLARSRHTLHHAVLRGASCYLAPEISTEGPYDEKVDIYSLALSFLEFFTQKRPLLQSSSFSKSFHVMKCVELQRALDPSRLPDETYFARLPAAAAACLKMWCAQTSTLELKFVREIPPKLQHLLYRMLSFDPSQRPTTQQALDDSCFDSIRGDDGDEDNCDFNDEVPEPASEVHLDDYSCMGFDDLRKIIFAKLKQMRF